MRKKSFFAVAVSATALAGLSAGPAFAGEVTGPPGTPNVAGSASGKPTGAVLHAHSACAFNGLNDMNPAQGQIALITQNYGANKKLGLDPAVFGFPGTGCNPNGLTDSGKSAIALSGLSVAPWGALGRAGRGRFALGPWTPKALFAGLSDAGGGTRTPDTRIMIPLL